MNAKVARYILDSFRSEWPGNRSNVFPGATDRPHLLDCGEATVDHLDGGDGFYGCDTGCEYIRLSATIRCPHGEAQEYDYGLFGELSDILDDLDI